MAALGKEFSQSLDIVADAGAVVLANECDALEIVFHGVKL
jgi:hypothetical protein